jgi:predicted O-methyltransferase YrrM
VNILYAYLQYRWNSLFIVRKKNDFVCSIEDSRRKNKGKLKFEDELLPFREETKNSKRKIEVTDFGAGSKRLGNSRTIQSIYKTSVANRKWQRFMHQLIVDKKAVEILEMGTSLGFSTVYLSQATKGKVTTIEACPATYDEAKNLFDKLEVSNIEAVNDTFSNYFEDVEKKKFDFIYLDGHHDGEAVLQYIEQLKPSMAQSTLILVDDIRWSAGMFAAWNKLLVDDYFSEKNDLFRMGILKKGNV